MGGKNQRIEFCNRYSFRRRLKIRIFVRDQGEAEDQPAGILKYVEDLRRGLNADIGRKDFFRWLLIWFGLKRASGMIRFLAGSCLGGLGIFMKEP